MLAPTILLALLPGSPERPLASLDVHQLVARIPNLREAQEADSQDLRQLFAALAELRERIAHGARLEFEDWRFLILDRGLLSWRDRWPKGVPFAVGFHEPQIDRPWGLELVPRIPGWKAAHCEAPGFCGNGARERFEAEDYQVLGALPETESDIVFDLDEIEWASPEHCLRTRLGEIRLHVRAMPNFDDCLPALRDTSLAADVGRRLAAGVRVDREDCEQFGPAFRVELEGIERTPGLGVGLNATLKRRGVVLESTLGMSTQPGYDVLWDSWDLPHDSFSRRFDYREFTLVLRGDPYCALRDWNAKRYWAGEIEVPLADATVR